MTGAVYALATLGGPTAVLNASILGFASGVGLEGEAVGVCGGPNGLVTGQVRSLGDGSGFGELEAGQPGSWLGAGRYLLTEEEMDRGLRSLADQGVRGLAVLGGNGTMACCHELAKRAEINCVPIAVVGVPKTIDNDLCGTDHSPGFLSAAQFVVEMVADLAFDHRAMRSIEDVRIVETLGRNSGWLALSSLLARRSTRSEPHLVYIPERRFDEAEFLAEVEQQVSIGGAAFVVVAEGAAGNLFGDRFERSSFDRPIEGGVARVLAHRVREQLGLRVRAEIPGLVQRCSTRSVSALDRLEAFAVGREAAHLLAAGVSGLMVTVERRDLAEMTATISKERLLASELRNGLSNVTLGTIPLAEVAGRTRQLPADWVPTSAADSSPAFENWLETMLAEAGKEQTGSVSEDAVVVEHAVHMTSPTDPGEERCAGAKGTGDHASVSCPRSSNG